MSKAQNAYQDFGRELEALEKSGPVKYLFDDCVDTENVYPLTEDDGEEFWSAMLHSGEMAAGQRAEAVGEDINELLGRVIY